MKKNDETDDYYCVESIKAIEAAIKDAKNKPPDQLRFLIRRSYPFGPQRKGRNYKIWNRLVLEKEAELGFAPRKHKSKAGPENDGFDKLFDSAVEAMPSGSGLGFYF